MLHLSPSPQRLPLSLSPSLVSMVRACILLRADVMSLSRQRPLESDSAASESVRDEAGDGLATGNENEIFMTRDFKCDVVEPKMMIALIIGHAQLYG